MPTDCIFCKIIAGTIPCDKVYEDEHVIAFRDIHPKAPTHLLVVPRKHVTSVSDLAVTDLYLMEKIFAAIQKVATTTGVSATGYRTIINNGREAGQEVFHLHVHILGGRRLGSMG